MAPHALYLWGRVNGNAPRRGEIEIIDGVVRPTMATHDPPSTIELSASLSIEDQGTEFYLISEGDGHDLTFSLDDTVAEHLATFIIERMKLRSRAGLTGSSN